MTDRLPHDYHLRFRFLLTRSNQQSTGFETVLKKLVAFVNENIQEYPRYPNDKHWDAVSQVTFLRTYSRFLYDHGHTKECWRDTVFRVVAGVYYTVLMRIPHEVSRMEFVTKYTPETLFDIMYKRHMLPGGRGLWAMGTQMIHVKEKYAALNNCGFKVLWRNTLIDDFIFILSMEMKGVGMGMKVNLDGKALWFKGAQLINDEHKKYDPFIVEDSAEGWCAAVRHVLEHVIDYTGGLHTSPVQIPMYFGKIRPKGSRMNTFGGTACGPTPLIRFLTDTCKYALHRNGEPIDHIHVVDLCNMAAIMVVAGNIRRVAQIITCNASQAIQNDFAQWKNYDKYAYRAPFGYASNNSIEVDDNTSMHDVDQLTQNTYKTGEPGFFFVENARRYGRFVDDVTYADVSVHGCNPCAEQSLEDGELCNLVETFPSIIYEHCVSKNICWKPRFMKVCQYAAMYAKVVSLLVPLYQGTELTAVSRNRRYGISQTGVVDLLTMLHEDRQEALKSWSEACNLGYNYIRIVDGQLADLFDIPTAIKVTSIKPSGTISLLAGGVSPGIHPPLFDYYKRRIRVASDSPFVTLAKAAGTPVEKCAIDPTNTCVLTFYKKAKGEPGSYTWFHQPQNLFMVVAVAQHWWADNQVSVTFSFDPKKFKQRELTQMVFHAYLRLKGISFLPKDDTIYPQMPYEEIDAAQYYLAHNKHRIDVWLQCGEDDRASEPSLFCSSDKCMVVKPT
jgi:ribonucleoside-triphosphate reductase